MLATPTGIEDPKKSAKIVDLRARRLARLTPGEAEVARTAQTENRDNRDETSVAIADLKPPSALLRSMLDAARSLSPEDRRELLRELANALADEPSSPTVKAS